MINYYKGKEMYLSVDTDTKDIIVLIAHPGDYSIRVVKVASFYDKISEDLTKGVIEVITEEVFSTAKAEIAAVVSAV